jgi:D-alanyl-D-alanine carboxypeptidase
MTNKQQILNDKANSIVAEFGTPNIAAVLVRDGGDTTLVSVQGVRDASGSQTATRNQAAYTDYFNVGSISKPLFGLMLACYIKKGVLGWRTRVGDVFPEFRAKAFRQRCGMNENFLDAMVHQLMAHTSGVGGTYYFELDGDADHRNGDSDPFRFMSDGDFSDDTNPRGPEWKTDAALRYQRYLYAVLCMKKARFTYGASRNLRYENKGNSGYTSCSTICAAMLERKTGKSFETLMDDVLQRDLAMPIRRGRLPAGMQYHRWDDGQRAFATLPHMNNDFANYGPKFMTGGIHATTQGMAAFIKYNLRALDHSAVFDVEDYQRRVTDAARGGLFLNPNDPHHEPFWHSGETKGSTATVHIHPHAGWGYAVMQSCAAGPVRNDVNLSWRALNAMNDALREMHANW